MDSFLFLTTFAAGIGFFTLYRKPRFHHHNKEKDSSSPSPCLTPSVPASHIWTHHVFPSFRGEDVRRDFLSHIQMEFQRMGISLFIDNDIKRGESIGPELVRAIRESKIAIILLSRNYASSKWCLDELVEIMKCKEEFGQTVMAIFYKLDPSDVKKLTGDFGKVFRKTCYGKTKEDTERWRQALAKVATIAGYHSDNWDNEAAMIKKIATDISNKLNNLILARDFDGLIGMRAHLDKMEALLCLDSDEVRMIGIWGPPGIGKTTIARVAYNQLSYRFQLCVFMENINANYTRPCSDDYSAKLQLQQQFVSRITNHKDMEITHLGVAQDRLKDKRVLVVLDGVNQSVQLDAMAKETSWFGSGSRIIITAQDHKLFRAHGVNHIYEVGFPTTDVALQILCMYAFGQKSPKDGFEALAQEATTLVGNLPLGLRVMGSYFRGMSKQEWRKSLPRLWSSLNADIQGILKFSYDALDDEDKDLFLHVACFFNSEKIKKVEGLLAKKFGEVRQRLDVLAEKSLISIEFGQIKMHSLLKKLGREIVRKQSIHEPGQRSFLFDVEDIREVLTSNTAGCKSVIGIHFDYYGMEEELVISERAFEGMSNLQFLERYGYPDKLYLTCGLSYLSSKLRLLHWTKFPMTCLPFIENFEFLVELNMSGSKLEKLWGGVKPIRNLKWIDLSYSANLKELPDLSTAINLEKLSLHDCSSLIKLPSSIGNATSLKELDIGGCSSLVEIPSVIGYATNLEKLDLSDCSNLEELPLSIGNLQKLEKLILRGCTKLEVLPTKINLQSLNELDLNNCSMLKSFPEISTNVKVLKLRETAIEEVPPSINSWSRLDELHMSYFENLKEFPHALDRITKLYWSDIEIQEAPPWVFNRISRLKLLKVKKCRKLSLELLLHFAFLKRFRFVPFVPLNMGFCPCQNPRIHLNFAKCFKLNEETRDLIIQTPTSEYVVLPGREVPSYFAHRATGGGPTTIKLNERLLPTYMRFKACILLVNKFEDEARRNEHISVSYGNSTRILHPALTGHLYTFQVTEYVTSSELVFEFKVDNTDRLQIAESGIVQVPWSCCCEFGGSSVLALPPIEA